jgi:hypothetical protein
MNKENIELLQVRFPLLCSDTSVFKFQCGDGWVRLIYELLETLEKYILDHELPKGTYPVVLQIKEKFGLLRFYINNASPSDTNYSTWSAMYDMIDKTEDQSIRICEECGEIGWLAKSETGWLKTRCSEHMKDDHEYTTFI